MGIAIKIGGLTIGGGGVSWSSYWMTHLFGEHDLNFWAKERSGFSLLDDFGNNASILTPSFFITNANTKLYGAVARSCEKWFDGTNHTAYFKFKKVSNISTVGYPATKSMIQLGSWVGSGRGVNILFNNGHLYLVFGDGATFYSHQILANFNNLDSSKVYELFLEVDFDTKFLRANIYDGANAIGSAVNRDISAFVFNANNNTEMWQVCQLETTIADLRKFTGLKTLSQCRDYDYVTGLEVFYPDLYSKVDVSGNGNHWNTTNANYTKHYWKGSSYMLDKGHTRYKSAGSIDIHVPYDVNGNPIYTSVGNFYVPHEGKAGNVNYHNLADSLIVFASDSLDRSNATIFEDEARLNYYDAANPKRWHITEFNRLILCDYFKSGYKGLFFSHISENSTDERNYLLGLLMYNTDKTGNDLTKVLLYTGDDELTDKIYLKTPYTDVINVTANSDSEFKLKINDGILYSLAELKALTDSVPVLNTGEDFISKMFRFIMSNSYSNQLLSLYQDAFTLTNPAARYLRNPLLFLNSWPYGTCSELAQFVISIFKLYGYNPKFWKLGGTGHAQVDYDTLIDAHYGLLNYIGANDPATRAEIEADKYLFIEPLRTFVMDRLFSSGETRIQFYPHITGGSELSDMESFLSIDNLSMKLTAGSTMIFPVKTANVPKNDAAADLVASFQAVVTSPTGSVGTIDMPFLLLQITGAGSVEVNGVEYTLPTDEAALKAVLQSFDDFYHEYEILTNTGGIVAEYLFDARNILLYNINKYSLTQISGSVTVGKIVTATPLTSIVLSVGMDYTQNWSINQYWIHEKPDSIKIPLTHTGVSLDYRWVNFYNKTTGKRSPSQSNIANTSRIISGAATVYDTCFASKLLPGVDSFSGSVELSFVTYDGSSCYYTLDGTTPDATKTLYSAPFTITATKTVKWINIKADYANSHVNTRVLTKV